MSEKNYEYSPPKIEGPKVNTGTPLAERGLPERVPLNLNQVNNPDAVPRERHNSGVLTLKIKDFDKVGPVRVRVVTVPDNPEDGSEEVFVGWMKTDTMGIAVEAGKEPPYMAKGWRYPQEVARVVSKETRKPINPEDKASWPEDIRLSGATHRAIYNVMSGKREPLCRHNPPCSPPVSLTEGIILDNLEPWVLRVEGPPVRQSELQAVEDREAGRQAAEPEPSALAPGEA